MSQEDNYRYIKLPDGRYKKVPLSEEVHLAAGDGELADTVRKLLSGESGKDGLDGSSGTYYIKDGVYGVTSRHVDFKVEENPNNMQLGELVRQYIIEHFGYKKNK